MAPCFLSIVPACKVSTTASVRVSAMFLSGSGT